MAQLFSHYTVAQVIVMIVIIGVAVKGFIDFMDWAKKRTKQAVQEANKPNQLEQITEKHERELNDIRTELNDLKLSINLLIESDKDNIKHSITKDHHYFCYKLRSIDDYSLDCIERRYSHYQDQGGNSFIQNLMEDLRALPRKLVTENRQ